MSDGLVIVLTAGLVATGCGLLGPFLVLRRVALLGDAVSHAVLPGIVGVWLLLQTRATVPVIVGAALFAVLCVLAIDWLRETGLVGPDAAIALVFPALFALGVLGVQQYADDLHLDLDSTIYGEIAFAPFRTWIYPGGIEVAQSIVVAAVIAAIDLLFVVALWKELKVTSFDPGFARSVRIPPKRLSQALLVLVAITAVTAFDAVGAILVVTLLIVPAAAAQLLATRLWAVVAIAVGIGWIAAIVGYEWALSMDASIAGCMGLVCAACFTLAAAASTVTRRRRRPLPAQ